MPNAPYLKAAKSMAEVCGSASVYDYLRRECEKAWDEIKNRDARIADQFIVTFNQFLPIQALAFASNRIENADCADVSEEILGMNSTSDGSMPLQISVSLMNSSEYSQTASELFVKCVGNEAPSERPSTTGHAGRTALSLTISIVRDSIWKTANSMPSLKNINNRIPAMLQHV